MNQITQPTNNTSVEKLFIKYVSQNILSMIGISAYVLADTLFIAHGEGANGITALNLVLPLYSLIFAFGSMIGLGTATRFKIYSSRNDKKADFLFSNAVFWAIIIGLIGVFAGIFMPGKIVAALGGDDTILALGTTYTRIFLLFTPFFILNYICTSFVRNDGNPSQAMVATLASNFFNIVMDYVLMFPCGMGMAGAALATACSPIVSIIFCCFHIFSRKSHINLCLQVPSFKLLFQCCQLGITGFVGEIASGVSTMIFNFLILSISGNVGVAAFGIVVNIAIVATCIFNGIAQGAQPLFSEFYGKGQKKAVSKVLQLSVVTAMVFAILIVLCMNLFPEQIVDFFNSENNRQMAELAVKGTRLYFPGFLFAGFNIVGMGYLSATEQSGLAFLTSIIRGLVAISLCAVVLARLFAMTGVWLAFPVAEFLSGILILFALLKTRKAFKI